MAELKTCLGTLLIQFKQPDPISFTRFFKLIQEKFKNKDPKEGMGQVLMDNRTISIRSILLGNIEIMYSSDLGQITVVTTDMRDLIKILPLLIKSIDTCCLNIKSNPIEFYEIFPKFCYLGKKNPFTVIKKAVNVSVKDNFGEIFRKDFEAFSIRLSMPFSSKNGIPIRKIVPWFDMKIFPRIEDPRQYAFEIVFRSNVRKEYMKFIQDLLEKMNHTIEQLEAGD